MKPLALILLFSASMSAVAQDAGAPEHPECKSYFMTFWADRHIPGGMISHWEKSQEKWFLGAGQKKYPTVCKDAKKATYLLVYTTEQRSVRVTQFERLYGGSQNINGTVTSEDGKTSSVDATVDTPAVDIPMQRTVQRQSVYMYVFTTGSTPFFSGGKARKRPLEVFVERQHRRPLSYVVGEFAGPSDAARDAFEDSIRFISKAAPN